MSRNDTLDAILGELRRAGISPTVEHGSNHIKVRWVGAGGRPAMAIAPHGSHANGYWRGPKLARATVRRSLRN
jgi:hypothetical protein